MTDVVATEALTEDERMVLLAARELRDGETCFVGVGVPSLAAMLAKRTHAPDLVLIYESGAIDADPPQPPLSTGSPSIVANTSMLGCSRRCSQAIWTAGCCRALRSTVTVTSTAP